MNLAKIFDFIRVRVIGPIVFWPLRCLALCWGALMGAVPYSSRRRYINNERRQKAKMIARVAKAYGIDTFVETGTHLGDTTNDLRDAFSSLVTIEIDPALHSQAKKRFASQPQIKCILGDSGIELAKIAAALDEATLFWLDGHYSGDGTGGEGSAAPLRAELDAVSMSPRQDHVIVIDDISDFVVQLGQESLSSVLAKLETMNPNFRFYFDFDMLFVVPGEREHRDFWRNIAMATYVR